MQEAPEDFPKEAPRLEGESPGGSGDEAEEGKEEGREKKEKKEVTNKEESSEKEEKDYSENKGSDDLEVQSNSTGSMLDGDLKHFHQTEAQKASGDLSDHHLLNLRWLAPTFVSATDLFPYGTSHGWTCPGKQGKLCSPVFLLKQGWAPGVNSLPMIPPPLHKNAQKWLLHNPGVNLKAWQTAATKLAKEAAAEQPKAKGSEQGGAAHKTDVQGQMACLEGQPAGLF